MKSLARQILPAAWLGRVRDVRDFLVEIQPTAHERRSRVYQHQLHRIDAERLCTFEEYVRGAEDEEIVRRLIEYFNRQGADPARPDDVPQADLWSEITKGHALFEDALRRRDNEAVQTFLAEIGKTPLVVGLNFTPYNRLRYEPRLRRREALSCIDKLLCLSDALGATPVQTPEG
jgi:hypothetical protein